MILSSVWFRHAGLCGPRHEQLLSHQPGHCDGLGVPCHRRATTTGARRPIALPHDTASAGGCTTPAGECPRPCGLCGLCRSLLGCMIARAAASFSVHEHVTTHAGKDPARPLRLALGPGRDCLGPPETHRNTLADNPAIAWGVVAGTVPASRPPTVSGQLLPDHCTDALACGL